MEKASSFDDSREGYDLFYVKQKYNEVNDGVQPYALVQLNIKNFRYYNAKFGAEAGDEILRQVFDVLLDSVEEREYAGHLYTDNFGLLIRYDDMDDLIYNRLTQLIDRVYRIKDERIYRNQVVSIGIYSMKDNPVSFHNALSCANLCRRLSSGIHKRCSNIEVYSKEFCSKYMDRMDLEARTADAYKNYEFINYVQPKVDLKTEQIVGAEALLRWFDKDGNNIPVSAFLPTLDDNGYITLVDIDTFEQTCSHLQERMKKNQAVVPISFNISKHHFHEPNIVEDYINVFEKYKIPKSLIEFELMESIAFNEAERLNRIVSQFKEYGFSCSLDDFGNGYSSFNVLLNAPLDTVKMDRQFFLNNLNGNSELVIETVVNLIHSLDMKVVAEGVEKESHIEWLKNCGCDCVQGYYYYKPMPLEEFDKLLDLQKQKEK